MAIPVWSLIAGGLVVWGAVERWLQANREQAERETRAEQEREAAKQEREARAKQERRDASIRRAREAAARQEREQEELGRTAARPVRRAGARARAVPVRPDNPPPTQRRITSPVRRTRAPLRSTTPYRSASSSSPAGKCVCGAPLPGRRNWDAVRKKQEYIEFPDPDPYHHLCDRCHERRRNGLPLQTSAEARRWDAVIAIPTSQWKRTKRSNVWYCDTCRSTIPAGINSWSVFLPSRGHTVTVCDGCSARASAVR